jgi:hypothetical protein
MYEFHKLTVADNLNGISIDWYDTITGAYRTDTWGSVTPADWTLPTSINADSPPNTITEYEFCFGAALERISLTDGSSWITSNTVYSASASVCTSAPSAGDWITFPAGANDGTADDATGGIVSDPGYLIGLEVYYHAGMNEIHAIRPVCMDKCNFPFPNFIAGSTITLGGTTSSHTDSSLQLVSDAGCWDSSLISWSSNFAGGIA